MAVRARVVRAWRGFRVSLLFMPAILTVGALSLFVATSLLDSAYHEAIVAFVAGTGGRGLGFLVFAGGPSSAEAILSGIVSTWATIAGVVYSVTLVTIQLSATKYSAQVIPVFEKDLLNQFVLGVFTGTFAYALLVLKTVRAGDDTYVPFVGVNVAVVLALVSLFMLVAFIGNLTAYIRPTRFVEDYAETGLRSLDKLEEPLPESGYAPLRDPVEAEDDLRGAIRLAADTSGYVGHIHWVRVRDALEAADPTPERIEVRVALGKRVDEGEVLVLLWGVREIPEAIRGRLAAAFRIEPTPPEQEPGQVAETLADIGVTALSGGATDVGVAKTALRSILRLASAALEHPGRPRHYHVRLSRDRAVLLIREDQRFYAAGFHAAKRVMDKAAREAYWDVGEVFAAHVGTVLTRAARCRADVWDATLDWFRPIARHLFGFDDRAARHRVVRHLRRATADMRRDGQDARALDIEYALLEAAREAGIEPEVREAIARHG